MSGIDWAVLGASLLFIVGFGVWKNRHAQDLSAYLVSSRTTPWYMVAVSIMATQASAITFLSTPGQAYADGMRFVQFYFGLPLAMVVLSITAVPIYHRLKVFTAYEYLENRFDLKTRSLASGLFLIQRGLSTGLSIYATAIVLSVILGWNIYITNLVMGVLVIFYTASGGARAVNWTQSHQFFIAMVGIFSAFIVIIHSLPADVSFHEAAQVAGKLGRLKTIDFTFDLKSRYNVWSGLLGGFFLQLSYFGTDQSQVGRYLGGRSIAQSRLGLLFNGLVKIPMQFFILFLGAMVFVFYQFVAPPVFFNPVEVARAQKGPYAGPFKDVEARHQQAFREKKVAVEEMVRSFRTGDQSRIDAAQKSVMLKQKSFESVRGEAIALFKKTDPRADGNDTNYIFLNFVIHYLPVGLVGLVLAVVFAASMSSNSAAMSALASTTVVDVYLRLIRKNKPDAHYVRVSKLATVFWGVFAIVFAEYANHLGTLIEAVNILGSLVYPTILGIFLLAFYFPKVQGNATFIGAIVGEAVVVACWLGTTLPFLWYNVVGCAVVILVALLLTPFMKPVLPAKA
ncbi:MAG: sodium:solute symporter [Thermoanaerobaculia bacterium]